MDALKFEKIRNEQYELTQKVTYLDTATTGLISKNANYAVLEFLGNRYENAMDIAGVVENWNFVDAFRNTVAQVINAQSDEIFFGATCSEMLNIFSNGIKLREDANVVTSGLSFPSTPYNWINRVDEKNIRIVPPVDGQIPASNLFKACDENTAVIALCLVENSTGFCHDLKEIGAFCEKNNIYLVLDISQCIGAIEVDVAENHVDFIAASTYKWMGGMFGVAIGYASSRVLDRIETTNIGWAGNKSRLNHSELSLNLSGGAKRFECGNLNWIGLKGIEQSIKLYL